MTARRGSLRYKIVRLARARPGRSRSGGVQRLRRARTIAIVLGRGLMACAALCLTVMVGAGVWHAGMREMDLRRQIALVDRQNAALASANDDLALRVQRLHDPEYLVPLIHEQLGLTKPNEVFIELTPSSPAPQP